MPISADRLEAFLATERAAFARARPKGAARSARSGPGFWNGLPQHWMLDWAMPFAPVIVEASGTRVVDLDGHLLTDLCLGDTGAMYGHAPPAIARVLAERGEAGLTVMLPGDEAERAGSLLARTFGLPWWQVTLSASDANRFALRAARLITGRRKVLVFDGCYHGAVDEGGVMLVAGRTAPKPSLWGQAFELGLTTVCVPFNDVAALETALASGDVACVMTEPALTNCGIIAPEPGFLDAVRDLTRRHGTLLLIDETHTLSVGVGGWTRRFGLEPDLFVAGKAVAGGVPCGVWGFTEDVRRRFEAARARLPAGHSGVGTTLAGSALQTAAIAACLSEVMTPAAHARMERSAAALEAEILQAAVDFDLDWCVVRLGARLETVFAPVPPRNAEAMRRTFNPRLEAALVLGLVNRGFLVTPFHTMLLAGPDLPPDAPKAYGEALRAILESIVGS